MGKGSEDGVWTGNNGFDGDDVHLAPGNNVIAIPYDGDVFQGVDEARRQSDYPAIKFESPDLAVAVGAWRDPVLYFVSGAKPLVSPAPNQTHRYWLWFAHNSVLYCWDILEKEPICKYI
jgi:hypothetical protein